MPWWSGSGGLDEIAVVEQLVGDVVERRVVGPREQRFERRARHERGFALLHRRPRAVGPLGRVAAPEARVPAQELAQARAAVLVERAGLGAFARAIVATGLLPVLACQRDVAAVDRDALAGRDVPVLAGDRLTEDPRLDQRPARDHHRRAAARREVIADLVRVEQVAVADDRHRHGGGDLGDGVPVGRMTVPRFARAAVHGDRGRAGVDGRAREIEKVARVGVPAEANLDGDGHLHGRAHRFDDEPYAIRLAAERRAEAHPREVIDRAAEIQIDAVGAARFDERRGPRHLLGPIAGELHAEARLVVGPSNQRELAAAPLLQPARHDHLAHEHARAQLDAQPPIGQVRSLRHRRHDDGAGKRAQEVHRALCG